MKYVNFHPKPGLWKHQSRADDVIGFLTGWKTDLISMRSAPIAILKSALLESRCGGGEARVTLTLRAYMTTLVYQCNTPGRLPEPQLQCETEPTSHKKGIFICYAITTVHIWRRWLSRIDIPRDYPPKIYGVEKLFLVQRYI